MYCFVRAMLVGAFAIAMNTPVGAAEFTARDLAQEESKFAAYSVQHGMRAAFLEFFA